MNTVEQRQRRNLPYVLAVVRCDNIVDLKMIRTFHDKTVGATTPRIREEFAKVFHPEPSKSLQSLMAPFAWLIFHSNKWLKTITRLWPSKKAATDEVAAAAAAPATTRCEWTIVQNEIVKFSHSAREKHWRLNDDGDGGGGIHVDGWPWSEQSANGKSSSSSISIGSTGANHTLRPKAGFSNGAAACRQESYRIERQTKRRCFNVFLCCNGSGIVVSHIGIASLLLVLLCYQHHRHHVGDSLVVLQLYINLRRLIIN